MFPPVETERGSGGSHNEYMRPPVYWTGVYGVETISRAGSYGDSMKRSTGSGLSAGCYVTQQGVDLPARGGAD